MIDISIQIVPVVIIFLMWISSFIIKVKSLDVVIKR